MISFFFFFLLSHYDYIAYNILLVLLYNANKRKNMIVRIMRVPTRIFVFIV